MLHTIEYEGMEIETCPGCEGEWLDAGELGHIVRTIERAFTAEEVRALEVVRQQTFRTETSTRSRLRCPKCADQELTPFNYASSSGIILDKCPGCAGIWLDKHELEMVQALVEDWNVRVQHDANRFGGVIESARLKSEKQADPRTGLPRFGFVLAILRPFV